MIVPRWTGRALVVAAAGLSHAAPLMAQSAPEAASLGPLVVSRRNPRYFETPAGQMVLLTGSHTWMSFQDHAIHDPPAQFDYAGYLGFLKANGHNFFRLWVWEQAAWSAEIRGNYWFTPSPYLRTGPGRARDWGLRFDLNRFDPAYFERLRRRVAEAGAQGMYVSVMLFNGWSVGPKGDSRSDNPWQGHPLNGANNINQMDGDLNRDGFGYEIQTLADPAVTALQEAYVRRVIDAVNQFDNVLYEVANEAEPASRDWQYHMIRFVKRYEARKPKQHPVGMTLTWPDGPNTDLLRSPADWISPAGTLDERPAAAGAKVVLSDTDHLCGACGTVDWVWESFTRGENPILMDAYDGAAVGTGAAARDQAEPRWEAIRRNMGLVRSLAGRLRLDVLVPRPDLASTGYCLAATGISQPQYVVYLPTGGTVTVDMSSSDGPLGPSWLDPRTGALTEAEAVSGGATRAFRAPFPGAAVLVLH